MTKLYLVEGLPCSGKSTTAKFISEKLSEMDKSVILVDEGSGKHPADFEFHAYVEKLNESHTVMATDSSFLVEVICGELNIRQKADFNSKVVGTVKRGEIYTIIKEEDGLGKLKSGVGYISLNTKYVKRK